METLSISEHYHNSNFAVNSLRYPKQFYQRSSTATQEFLLFPDSYKRKIMKVSPHDSRSLRSLPLPDVMRYPVAIGYDVVEDRVYWTDAVKRTISRAFLNGSSFEDIFNTTLISPYGLAVDIIGRNLYWTDHGTGKLEVSKLDGSHRTALITREIYAPREIVIDVNKGSVQFLLAGSKFFYSE